MQARRLAKRSSLGSRRLSASPSAAQPLPKLDNSWRPPRREGSAAALEEEDEEEDVVVDVEEEDDADEAEAGGGGASGSPPPAEHAGPGRGHAAARGSHKNFLLLQD
ncbi:zinc finger protein 704-like [Lacerta agilis]|uniref:zinc finger protein 704-like n=1 Tax=Lacerta agilis TaxID=80427 RepID=UPI001419F8A7|nr:zinc finger protein 704-like [Lacerta agilis]